MKKIITLSVALFLVTNTFAASFEGDDYFSTILRQNSIMIRNQDITNWLLLLINVLIVITLFLNKRTKN